MTELKKAEKIRDKLVPELLKLVIGKSVPGFKCNCGALHHGHGKVFMVDPAGRSAFYQIADFDLWRCKIRDDDAVFSDDTDYSYVVGFDWLGEDVESNARKLFDEAFAEVDKERLYREYRTTNIR